MKFIIFTSFGKNPQIATRASALDPLPPPSLIPSLPPPPLPPPQSASASPSLKVLIDSFTPAHVRAHLGRTSSAGADFLINADLTRLHTVLHSSPGHLAAPRVGGCEPCLSTWARVRTTLTRRKVLVLIMSTVTLKRVRESASHQRLRRLNLDSV